MNGSGQERQTEGKREGETDRHAERGGGGGGGGGEREREIGRQTDRQTNTQRETDRQTDRQTGRSGLPNSLSKVSNKITLLLSRHQSELIRRCKGRVTSVVKHGDGQLSLGLLKPDAIGSTVSRAYGINNVCSTMAIYRPCSTFRIMLLSTALTP